MAVAVVVVELGVISWVRWKYMDTPPVSAALQVAFGGALVFAHRRADRQRLARLQEALDQSSVEVMPPSVQVNSILV